MDIKNSEKEVVKIFVKDNIVDIKNEIVTAMNGKKTF